MMRKGVKVFEKIPFLFILFPIEYKRGKKIKNHIHNFHTKKKTYLSTLNFLERENG